jgi:tetratricopeptide (TPR) repeat protein
MRQIFTLAASLTLFGALPILAKDVSDVRRLIAATRYTDAEAMLVEIAKSSDGDEKFEALFLLAGLKTSASEAELIYQEVAEADPQGQWGVASEIERAKIHYALGEYRKSFEILDSSAACRSSDEACYFQGLSAVMLRHYEQAREPLSRVKSGKFTGWAAIALAEVDAGLDMRSEACQKYRSVVRTRVAPTAKYRYGECLEEQGDVAGATRLFEEVIADFPQTPEAILASEKLEALQTAASLREDQTNPALGTNADEAAQQPTAGFTLQFGSFSDRANAIKLAAELKRELPGVRIDSELLNFKEVHRVRFGYFKTREEAERTAEDVSRQTGETCAIMRLP